MNCPYCRTQDALELLGSLGRTKHYRCRACGGIASRTPKARKTQPKRSPA